MIKNTVGNTYQCNWEKTLDGYSVWVVDNPKINAMAELFFECEDIIYSEIIGALGDSEAALEYIKELPEEALSSKYADPHYYALMSNYGGYQKNLSDYYVDGVCNVCKHAMGPRNGKNLTLSFKAQGTDSITIENSGVLIFSERVIDVLSQFSNESYEIRPVEFTQAKQNKFYELIWTDAGLSLDSVAVKDDSIGDFHGWRCSNCTASGSFYQDDRGLTFYTSRSPLVSSCTDVFLLSKRILCVSELVQKKLKQLNLKYLSVNPVGIVRNVDTNMEPNLEIRMPTKKRPKLP